MIKDDKYADMRVRNESGGYDLTADGWDEMARIHERITEATRQCAAALRSGGRLSVNFKTAHRKWKEEVAQSLELTGAGKLFDVGIRHRTQS